MRLPSIGWLLAMPAWSAASLENGKILVVADKTVAAYREAAEGIERGLGDYADAATVVTPGNAAAALKAGSVRIAIAVGADARAAIAKANATVPVVSTMLSLRDIATEAAPLPKPAGSVYLDLDVAQIAHEVGRLFPGKKRLGLIVASRQDGPNKIAIERLTKDGFQIAVAVSPSREELTGALRELKAKRVDMVLCLPETGLFDGRTIPTLLKASLEDQLPVVGFSPSFVRAGALVGVFPDYGDIGEQTAGVVRRALTGAGGDGGDETPRRVTSLTNPTVMRLLGWKRAQ
jgi:putative tryptophan/tyrosine transport system substrate-binding protein